MPRSEAASDPASHTSILNEYPNEERRQQSVDPEAREGTHQADMNPTPAWSGAPRRVAALPQDPYVQARLVTGTSSTPSLEQYRRLGAILHEEQFRRQLKTIMLTSAVPEEGKTLTVINLALTLSTSYDRRVLVIDADLRRPGIHTLLNLPNDCGLSEALRDHEPKLPYIELSNRLSVLTAGHPGSTPLAALASARMGELINRVASEFDWVLMDTSPVGLLSDAQVISRFVGGVIFVIGARSTPAAAVQRAIAEIGSDAVIGTVLNRVSDREIPAADYYGGYDVSRRRR